MSATRTATAETGRLAAVAQDCYTYECAPYRAHKLRLARRLLFLPLPAVIQPIQGWRPVNAHLENESDATADADGLAADRLWKNIRKAKDTILERVARLQSLHTASPSPIAPLHFLLT